MFLKYEHELQNENFFHRIVIKDLFQRNNKLIQNFSRIEKLCDDLYCTGTISNRVNAIINFYHFMNNEPFNFYYEIGEIKTIMDLIFIELIDFKQNLNKVIELFPYFIKIKDLIDISIIKKRPCTSVIV